MIQYASTSMRHNAIWNSIFDTRTPQQTSEHSRTQDFSSPLKSYKKISDLISYLQTIFINYDKKLHLPRRPSFIIGANIVILCYFSIRAIKIHTLGAKNCSKIYLLVKRQDDMNKIGKKLSSLQFVVQFCQKSKLSITINSVYKSRKVF